MGKLRKKAHVSGHAFAVLVAAVALLALCCTQVWADSNIYKTISGITLELVGTCEADGLQYQLFNKTLATDNNDLDENQSITNVATVSGYTAAANISIPDTVSYNGTEYKVWMLGNATKVDNKTTGDIAGWSFTPLFKGDATLCSVELPSGLYTITESSFYGCSSLKSVSFREPTDGGQISCGSIEHNAFSNCTALESFVVPVLENAQTTDAFLQGLASTEYYGSQTLESIGFSSYALSNCTALKEIVVEAGNGAGAYAYNMGYALFSAGESLEKVVYKNKADPSMDESLLGSTSGDAGIYYAIDYYGSKEAAVADDGDCDEVPYCAARTGRTHSARLARVELKNGTPVSAIATGDVDAYMYEGSYLESFDSAGKSDGTVPDATSAYNAAHGTSLAAGSCVWKLETPVGEYIETLDDSYYAYPVLKNDLSEGSVTQSNLTLLRSNFALLHAQHLSRDYWVADDTEGSRVFVMRGWGSMTAYRIYMQTGDSSGVETGAFIPVSSTGEPAISDMKVYLPDGSELALSACSINYYNTSGKLATAQELAQGGAFEMRISSAQANGTLSQWIVTESYSGQVVEVFTDNDAADQAARRIGSYAVRYAGTTDDAAAYGVIANSSNWRSSLIATSLAGIVGGYASLTEDSSVYNSFSNNFGATPPNRVIIIGDNTEVSRETVSSLSNLSSSPSTVRLSSLSTSLDCDDDPAVFALAVYNYMKQHDGSGSGTNYTDGATFGNTAVVFAQDSCFDTSAAASFVYANRAAVFFTNADGSISSELATALTAFKNVYVAASSDAVSDTTLTAIGATRVAGANELSACQMSLELAGSMIDAGATLKNVAIVDGSDPAYVASAAALAAKLDGVVLVSCSVADSKAITAYLRTHRDEVGTVYVLAPNGSNIQSTSFALADTLRSMWGSDYSSSATAVAAGDTFEYYGMKFEVTKAASGGSGTAKLVGTYDTTHALPGGQASCNGAVYAVSNADVTSTLAISYRGIGSATFPSAAPTEFDPSVATKIPNPKREGYQFMGWTVRSNGVVVAEGEVDLVLAANTYTHAVDLTASWGSATDDLSYATVTGVEQYYDYTGKSICPTPVVTLNGKTLKVDVDYEVSYSKNRDEGTAILYIDSLGSYAGSKKVEFEIVADRIANTVKFSSKKLTKTYGAKAFTLKASFGKKLGIVWSSSDTSVAAVSDSGKVTVKKPGVCTITASTASTESYKPASASCKLTVAPRTTSIKKVKSVKKGLKVTVAKRAEAKGYKLRYRAGSSGKWKTLTYTKNSPTTLAVSGLKAKTSYQVQVCTYAKSTGGTAASAWSKTKTAKTK